MKGNPSVIPGYDLTSQPATITMITTSECVQILSTDISQFILVERNEMDQRFGIKKNEYLCCGGKRRVYYGQDRDIRCKTNNATGSAGKITLFLA